MSTPAEQRPENWARERERSNLGVLRLMRWIAVTAGRPLARLVLHPIALYFLVAHAKARRASLLYLARALGRPAGWADAYRHIHAFASTVLDRVYFLQGQFERFEIRMEGDEALLKAVRETPGALLVGAHLGSFEALRASASVPDARVAMLMYEDNARQINATLAAIAPQAELRTIALGRPGAMLALRRWLDEGGLAGMLADRTLPGPSARKRALTLDFLGHPAEFPDGPFRLAAMLQRPLFFMAGLYDGGRRYTLHYELLADFRAGAAASDGLDAEGRIREAMARYVARLNALCVQAPYNWFNFYDFWSPADDAA